MICQTCGGSGRSARQVRLVRCACGHCQGTGREPERVAERYSGGVRLVPNPRLVDEAARRRESKAFARGGVL